MMQRLPGVDLEETPAQGEASILALSILAPGRALEHHCKALVTATFRNVSLAGRL